MKRSIFIFLTMLLIVAACTPQIRFTNTTPNPTASIIPTTIKATSSLDLPKPTPLPTLSKQSLEETISNLMDNNGNCIEFCFWGIKPGQTTSNDAGNFLSVFGRKVISGTEKGLHYSSITVPFQEKLLISMVLWNKGGYVDNIEVYMGQVEDQINVDDLMAFSPNSILNRYGVPSDVSIHLSFPTEPPLDDYIGYIYDIQYNGFIVEYFGQYIVSTGSLEICPYTDPGLESARIWIGKNPTNSPVKGVSILKATPLTIDEFYRQMIENKNKPCFELNPSVF